MKEPGRAHDLALLAALSHATDLAVGCYCEHEERCHRSVLRELLVALGATQSGRWQRLEPGKVWRIRNEMPVVVRRTVAPPNRAPLA